MASINCPIKRSRTSVTHVSTVVYWGVSWNLTRVRAHAASLRDSYTQNHMCYVRQHFHLKAKYMAQYKSSVSNHGSRITGKIHSHDRTTNDDSYHNTGYDHICWSSLKRHHWRLFWFRRPLHIWPSWVFDVLVLGLCVCCASVPCAGCCCALSPCAMGLCAMGPCAMGPCAMGPCARGPCAMGPCVRGPGAKAPYADRVLVLWCCCIHGEKDMDDPGNADQLEMLCKKFKDINTSKHQCCAMYTCLNVPIRLKIILEYYANHVKCCS